MKGFMYEAYKILEEDSEEKSSNGIKMIGDVGVPIHIINDILRGCDSTDVPSKFISPTSIMKCSKSAIKNALCGVNQGEDVKLCLGAYKELGEGKLCGHVWVLVGDVLLQTFPTAGLRDMNKNTKLIPYIEIDLVPNDIPSSVKKIKEILQ